VTAAKWNGSLHLFSIERDNRVFYRVIAVGSYETDESNGRILIGEGYVELAAIVSDQRGVELFGLTETGLVFRKAVAGAATGDWTQVGQNMNISGPLNVIPWPQGEASIVTVESSRNEIVLLKWLTQGELSESREWHRLCLAPPGRLSAAVIDDVLVLAILTEDERVIAARWSNYPVHPFVPEWRPLGTINSLLDAKFSLLSHSKEDVDRRATSRVPEAHRGA
jgi:hypothetical protein